MDKPKVIRVNKKEFELSDGRIYPHFAEFSQDELPSLEEFQALYDHWESIISNDLDATFRKATRHIRGRQTTKRNDQDAAGMGFIREAGCDPNARRTSALQTV